MKKALIALLAGAVVGGAAGFAAGIFFYPFIFLADIVAGETLADRAGRTLVATGRFIHANPADPVHYGSGGVAVYEDVVYLEEDFRVGPGPAFHVYLVPEPRVTPATDVAGTMFVDLGRLRAFQGSQVYPVPPGVDVADYPTVVIWCEHFGVLISPAALTFR